MQLSIVCSEDGRRYLQSWVIIYTMFYNQYLLLALSTKKLWKKDLRRCYWGGWKGGSLELLHHRTAKGLTPDQSILVTAPLWATLQKSVGVTGDQTRDFLNTWSVALPLSYNPVWLLYEPDHGVRPRGIGLGVSSAAVLVKIIHRPCGICMGLSVHHPCEHWLRV